MRLQAIVAALLVCVIALPAGAAANALSLTSGTVERGKDVTLNLSLGGPGVFAGAQTRIDMPAGVGLVGVKVNQGSGDSPEPIFADSNQLSAGGHSQIALALLSTKGEGTFDAGGLIAQITISVAANAPVGTFPVTFVNSASSLAGEDGSSLPVDVTQTATLTIEPGHPSADIDSSGDVNAIDVQLVVNAVLGIDISPRDGDVNHDGQRNAVDVQTVVNAVLGIVTPKRRY